jgi:hypothetical protein
MGCVGSREVGGAGTFLVVPGIRKTSSSAEKRRRRAAVGEVADPCPEAFGEEECAGLASGEFGDGEYPSEVTHWCKCSSGIMYLEEEEDEDDEEVEELEEDDEGEVGEAMSSLTDVGESEGVAGGDGEKILLANASRSRPGVARPPARLEGQVTRCGGDGASESDKE